MSLRVSGLRTALLPCTKTDLLGIQKGFLGLFTCPVFPPVQLKSVPERMGTKGEVLSCRLQETEGFRVVMCCHGIR